MSTDEQTLASNDGRVLEAPVKTESPSAGRKYALIALKWGLLVVILVVLYLMTGKNLAQLGTRKILWQFFAGALAVRFISLLATFSRWRLLVGGIGLPLSMREGFRLGMLGEACNLMGPGAVGGDLVKAALLAKDHTNRIASIFATVFLDRVLGMWALFLIGSIASFIPASTKPGPEQQWAVWALWGGSLAGLIGIGLMLMPSFTHSRFMHWLTTWKFVGRIVKELMDSVELYQGKPQILLGAAALGILGHFGYLSSFYLCAVSMNNGQVYPGYVDHIVGLPLPEAFSAAVPTPGGVGALEAAVGWVYQMHLRTIDPHATDQQLEAAFANGLFTAVGYRLTLIAWGAVGIIFYMSSRKEISQAIQGMGEETARHP